MWKHETALKETLSLLHFFDFEWKEDVFANPSRLLWMPLPLAKTALFFVTKIRCPTCWIHLSLNIFFLFLEVPSQKQNFCIGGIWGRRRRHKLITRVDPRWLPKDNCFETFWDVHVNLRFYFIFLMSILHFKLHFWTSLDCPFLFQVWRHKKFEEWLILILHVVICNVCFFWNAVNGGFFGVDFLYFEL